MDVLEFSRPITAIQALEVSVALSSCQTPAHVYRLLGEHLLDFFEAEACVVSEWDVLQRRMILRFVNCPPHWGKAEQWHHQGNLDVFPMLGRLISEAQPKQVTLTEIPTDSFEREFMNVLGVKRMLFFPMVTSKQVVGLVELMHVHLEGRTFTPQEMQLGFLLAQQAAIALEKVRAVEELRQRTAELEALRQVSLSLTSSLDLQEVLDAILTGALHFMDGAQDAHIFLYRDGRLKFGAALWANGRRNQPFAHPRPNGLTYTVARQGEIIVVDDMRTHPLYKDAPPTWTGSIVGIPLKVGQRVVGVMTIAHPQIAAFSEAHLRVLRMFGDQAAIAIENARLHRLVSEQAQTDPLTGLYNRRALDEQLEKEIHRAARYRQPLALLMIDLDQFKNVNDTYGHLRGDRLLQQIANSLRRSVRDGDFVARYGGDEFALLLPNTEYRAARKMALRLRQNITSITWNLPEANELCISFSFGIAVYPKHGKTGEELLKAADRALYQSKS